MTRFVLFSDVAQLEEFSAARDDVFVPLSDSAAHALAVRGWAERVLPLPDWGAIQAASLAEGFEAAGAILAALEADPAWRALLTYRDYDLRAMALKNVFFALEDLACVRHVAALAAAQPHDAVTLLDGDPAVRRAVASALPEVGTGLHAGDLAREWGLPVARFGRDRWRSLRAARPRPDTALRPIVAFLDAPHRARIMARTLALLAPDHPIHAAQIEPFAWPADLEQRPDESYPWYAYTSLGVAWRIARHVLVSRARTALEAFDLPGADWLPRQLLWSLRYNDVQRYANFIEGLEGLAGALHPALWFTLEDLFAFGKCAAAVGERHGIPTINVQHGIVGAYPYRTGIDVVGTFAAFGEASRETLIARGADPARIVVTGPVRYDDLLHLPPGRDGLLRGAGLDPARPVVLFASQPARRLITPAMKRIAIRALVDAAAQANAQVVIKAHPLEDASLGAILSEISVPVPVVQEDLYEWLCACDVMATISSTVVYEAALAERPALLLDWSGNSDVAGYVADGIGVRPASPGQVSEALNALLHDESARSALFARQRAFVTHHLNGNDGRASERLALLARRLMGESL
ncbi:UDP-N-acetylglucosamine 2-epimerase [Aggregatilinea lenta]|uniref:UDP-N-acetylglucosamine 2-epimerase n=1 Tax=Aggregatilinea lenta TaxID=913108 RepID=UPI0013C2B0F8|nr:UDP-N-acetylglucosamine 2-epimerase [Aggregatilinea lenta]